MDLRNKIRGCMIGGAAGDALGYPVEFQYVSQIIARYGLGGIKKYELDPKTGKALISDDTQMSLFTANGLLNGLFSGICRGTMGYPHMYVLKSYGDWLRTQRESHKPIMEGLDVIGVNKSWLMDVPELYSQRAPGNTCLSALEHRDEYPIQDGDYVKARINQSKGCGGVMRTAPVALLYGNKSTELTDMTAAQVAALTHGHPLGFLPSAVLNHILSQIVYGDDDRDLKSIIIESRDAVCEQFAGMEYIDDLREIIDKAVELSENDDNDLNNIHQIGQGWVAEETLAIAIYCSLKHEYDFSEGIIAAVNHNGDSDSTGAVTGNILGAINGFTGIEDKWKENLELKDIILEMADDLFGIHQIKGYKMDDKWIRRYELMRM